MSFYTHVISLYLYLLINTKSLHRTISLIFPTDSNRFKQDPKHGEIHTLSLSCPFKQSKILHSSQ